MCCCSSTTSARLLAIISIVISIFLIGTSSWILKDTYEERESAAYKVTTGVGNVLDSIGKFAGSDVQINAGQRINILLACSAVGITAGGLQLLSSILLLVGASGKSRSPSGIFSFVNMIGVLGIIGSLVCIFYQKVFDIEKLDSLSDQNKLWLAAMVSDGVFLLFSICGGISIMRS